MIDRLKTFRLTLFAVALVLFHYPLFKLLGLEHLTDLHLMSAGGRIAYCATLIAFALLIDISVARSASKPK